MQKTPASLSSERLAAYTNVRWDIVELVPAEVGRVLDLGCSDGTLGRVLKEQRPDRHVVGVEYSADLAQRAVANLDQIIQTDLNRPDALDELAGQQFDCVVCADVLEHLQHPWDLLARLRPMLAPGARLVISLPNIRHVSALGSIYLRGTFPRESRGIFDDTHLRWFTLRDGRQLLGDAGFATDKVVCSLRWGSKGGGRANRLLNRLLGPVAPRIAPVREFLTYQFALGATFESA
ncbi:bifunctional 2-polyprenyl-6-hydroxyphenol methylase/3-demethylubiquinol 3-O-methyltransferase UbiG [Pelomonas sp. KK5]|uniref:class I SAM-dependent methyltransferase n=1 Tax=Pelomonas sp. KK5 TaxID=1855730 RepID=UPI00097BC44D|nr:class I SAM-dependent methyltransferase [Pelomonas sp. KK5]